MTNILEEYNKLKLQLALTPEEKKKMSNSKLSNIINTDYIQQKAQMQEQVKALNRQISMNKEKIADLQAENEELKKQRNRITGKLQTIKARISRGEI